MPRRPDDQNSHEINTTMYWLENATGSEEEPVDVETSSLDDLVDESELEDVVSFEEALEAITEDSFAPNVLAGFNDISRKQVHELRRVWGTVADVDRRTIADTASILAEADIRLDFMRFFRVLLEDSSAEVRQIAAASLAPYDDPELLNVLLDRASTDENVDVRVASLEALRGTALLAADEMLEPKDVRTLRRGLAALIADQKQPSVVRAAALGTAAIDAEVPKLAQWIDTFYQSDDDELRLGAVQAMGAMSDPDWLPLLERALRSPDVDQREAAADSLAQYDDPSVVPMLTMAAREDAEQPVRIAAILGLGTLGSKESLQALNTLREYVSDDELAYVDEAIAEAQDFVSLEDAPMDMGFEFEPYESDDDEDDDEF